MSHQSGSNSRHMLRPVWKNVSKRFGWGSVIAVFLVFTIVAILFLWYFPFNQNSLSEVRRARMILSMLDAYTSSANRLPAATIKKGDLPLYSWRFALAASWENIGRVDWEGAWDGPLNKQYNGSRHPYFASGTIGEKQSSEEGSTDTRFFAFMGTGTAFEPGRFSRLSDMPNDLILFMSVSRSNVHWMEPGDFDASAFPGNLTTGDLCIPEGHFVLVAFADQDIWLLRPNVSADVIAKFITEQQAKRHSRDDLLGEFVELKSR